MYAPSKKLKYTSFLSHGFSLVEMAVVLVVISLVVGVSANWGANILEKSRRYETAQKLKTIEEALYNYRQAYHRLPCPADASLVTSNANYGVEAANSGSCTGGTPAANSSSQQTVAGAFPFKAIGLSEDMIYDGWGRKFSYVVNSKFTHNEAFKYYGLSLQCGNLTVKDETGASRTENAIYAVVSAGADGHGAYTKAGTRFDGDVTDTDSQENCDCDADAGSTTFDAAFVLKDETANFDDLLVYKERWQMDDALFDPINPSGPLECKLSHRIDGDAANIAIGMGVSAGDVNGDGFEDLIIGAPRTDYTADGSAYVIFGAAGGVNIPANLSEINGTNGIKMNGNVGSGAPLTGYFNRTGDINGDGFDDMLIGAHNYGGTIGTVYVVYGKDSGWSNPMDLSALSAASTGFRLSDTSYSGTGLYMDIGDVNGDGYDDMVIGSPYATVSSTTQAGQVFVVFGKASGWSDTFDLNTVNGTTGFLVNGKVAWGQIGTSVAVGNVNGDDYDDIVIGTYDDKVFIIFGKASGWSSSFDTATLNGTTGTTLTNDDANTLVVKDVNGDGVGDVIIGSAFADISANNAGSVYTYFGKTSGWTSSFDLSTLDGTTGFRVDGQSASDFAGISSWSDDINNDGINDIIIGATSANNSATDSGSVYVIYGKESGWSSSFGLGTLNGVNGFRVDGETASDTFGSSLYVGDFNADGMKDIAAGAWGADYNSLTNSGSTYIIWGGNIYGASQTLEGN